MPEETTDRPLRPWALRSTRTHPYVHLLLLLLPKVAAAAAVIDDHDYASVLLVVATKCGVLVATCRLIGLARGLKKISTPSSSTPLDIATGQFVCAFVCVIPGRRCLHGRRWVCVLERLPRFRRRALRPSRPPVPLRGSRALHRCGDHEGVCVEEGGKVMTMMMLFWG